MNTEYPAHVQRVINESNDLNEKIVALERFIKMNAIFQDLDPNTQKLMTRQLEVMKEYLNILDQRLVF